jgi:hypothetical protein
MGFKQIKHKTPIQTELSNMLLKKDCLHFKICIVILINRFENKNHSPMIGVKTDAFHSKVGLYFEYFGP